MLFQNTISTIPFHKWLYKDRENKRLLAITTLFITIQFIWFKNTCPYPNFVDETYSYLQAAANNDLVHIRPIGYSKFIQLIGLISHSHLLLVTVQYLLLQAVILYFFFTVRYLLNPGKWLIRVLIACTILNPLLLKLSNLITADALFATFSLLWFIQLCWLLYRPSRLLLAANVLILLLAFTMRHTAIYYPFVSILVILLSPIQRGARLWHIVGIFLLFGIYVEYTQYGYHRKTGKIQLSAFNGWQRANNALYAYAHTPLDSVNRVPSRFRKLHILVNKYMDSLNHVRRRPDNKLENYYLTEKGSPLNLYLRNDTLNQFMPSINRRLLMGNLYGDYGNYLIKQHRNIYIRYFLQPNLVNYFISPPEYTGYYFPFGIVDSVAIKWFHLTSKHLYTYQFDKRILVVKYMPTVFAIASIVFILGYIGFIVYGGISTTGHYINKIIHLSVITWICHLVFSVIYSPVVLRYQIFPLIIGYTFGVLFLVYIWQQSLSSYKTKTAKENIFA